MSSSPFESNQKPEPAPPAPNRPRMWLGIFFSIVFIVWGAQGIVRNVLAANVASASAAWPTAEATITESKVDEFLKISRRGADDEYKPRITYTYEVDGIPFESERIDYYEVAGTTNADDAQALLKEFPVGSKTKAYYKPDQPSFALLKPGMDLPLVLTAWVIRGLCGILFLLGVFGFARNGYNLFFAGRT